MKQLEIDPDKLTEYLIDNCPFLIHSDTGRRHCQIKRQKSCDVPSYMRDLCPDDCPRMFVGTTRCDEVKCKRIRKILKSLSKNENNL